DDLSTGRRENLASLWGHPRFTFLEHDVTRPLDVEEVELIYNLACPASPRHYQRDPVQTTRTCVLGALHVLELARRCGARVLQASTSEVYGDPLVHPQPEHYWGHVNPIGVRSCYDEGKRCAESLFFDFHRQHGVDVRVARIFNTYGPRMQVDDGRVVSNFIVQALTGRPLTLYGDGLQTRCFCFVDDMVDGLVALMGDASAERGPVNMGSPHEVTVQALATMVIALTDSSSTIEFEALPGDDPVRRRPDVTAAARRLGWRARTGLEAGLRQTVHSLRQALASPPRDERTGENPPMQIQKDTVVTLHYKLSDAKGKLLEQSTKDQPMVYLHGGYENTLPKIEEALDGQAPGFKVTLNLAPQDAFGVRDDSLARTIPKSDFPSGVKVGGQLQGRTDDGVEHVFTVMKIKGDQVLLDGNHPLAGQAVRFDLTVADVRTASEEEVAHKHVHGAHGHHH
ncbi:MAG: NAD-dependent epimerase/dehydratase family protein, partial [Comamonadaceae bacterium]